MNLNASPGGAVERILAGEPVAAGVVGEGGGFIEAAGVGGLGENQGESCE